MKLDGENVACWSHIGKVESRLNIASYSKLRRKGFSFTATRVHYPRLTQSLHRYEFHSPIPAATPRLCRRSLTGPCDGFGFAEIIKFLTQVESSCDVVDPGEREPHVMMGSDMEATERSGILAPNRTHKRLKTCHLLVSRIRQTSAR